MVPQSARRIPRTILHVDMDAFYASVETLLDPSLRGKPVIVGGSGERGVVASCSYEARAFGVRSAMSSGQAKRLCPHAVWVSGNHGVYGEYSGRIHEVFSAYTPLVEGIALDEAFLDVSGALRLLGEGPTLAARVRAQILHDTRLRCSVGVATSKLVAKLASEAAKPDPSGTRVLVGARLMSEGVVQVAPGDEVTFLHAHPVRALWGVGPSTMARLERFGVQTIGHLAALSEHAVIRALGEANGRHLHALANGVDHRDVEPNRAVKSIGHEETFSTDHHDLRVLRTEIIRLSDAVAVRMRAAGVAGRTVTLKLKFPDFRLISRSHSPSSPLSAGSAIAEQADSLMRHREVAAEIERLGVRLLGVSKSNLTNRATIATVQQLEMFTGDAEPTAAHDLSDVDDVVAAIRARFGADAVAPAVLTSATGIRIKRLGDTQWGPGETP